MDSSEYEFVELLFSKLQYYEILQSLGKLLLAALNITHTDTFNIMEMTYSCRYIDAYICTSYLHKLENKVICALNSNNNID